MRSHLVTLALVLSSACTLSNMTPQARFQDAAYTLNDASRWGRLDVASHFVAPEYAEAFASRHRRWGRQVSIADADLVHMQLGSDNDTATTEVSLNWYDTNGISVRTSVIAQTWKAQGSVYKLVDESIRDGDPRIFAEAEADTSGGAAPAETP